MVVTGEERITDAVLPFRSFETVEEFLGLLLVQFKFGANGRRIAAIETVFGELLLLQQPDVPVGFVRRPTQIVNALHSLQERADALEPVGEFNGNRVEVNAATLLKISELRNFKAVEKHLPSDAPRAECWRFPIVFLEANIVLLQVDADGAEAFQVHV